MTPLDFQQQLTMFNDLARSLSNDVKTMWFACYKEHRSFAIPIRPMASIEHYAALRNEGAITQSMFATLCGQLMGVPVETHHDTREDELNQFELQERARRKTALAVAKEQGEISLKLEKAKTKSKPS